MPIRLSPEDEKLGCDLAEHYCGQEHELELEKAKLTLDRIISISPQIANRFVGATGEKSLQDLDSFDSLGRRKTFHTNRGFVRNEHL